MTVKMTVNGSIAHVEGAEPGTGDYLRKLGYMVGGDGTELNVHLWPPSLKQPKDPNELRRILGLDRLVLGSSEPKTEPERDNLTLRRGDIKICICPSCGFQVEAERGKRCASLTCPDCNVPLTL